ncbi:MAG: NADH-quinone oxidoreductase subunit M [Candidatus Dormibacteraeota bacterium]|nr:NADH-quinone oxidoreductase subunit M [Candidatus Dormibacteraeota bacterium]
MNIPWLTVVLAVPIGASILVLVTPRSATSAVKGITVLATLVTAAIVGVLVANINNSAPSAGPLGFHYSEIHSWIPAIGATYHLGLDGVSAWFLALNAAVFLLAAVVVSRRDTERLKLFCGLLLLTETMTAGAVLSVDLLLFYLFWEGMLIPLYFILANYGNEDRGRATVKFIVYTVAGSLLMLVAIIGLDLANGKGFDLTALVGGGQSLGTTPLVVPGLNIRTLSPEQLGFIAFALAFAIKVPIVPFHTWLPDLYESAPVPVLMFFAGIVSKLGAYGFIRYCLTLFPNAVNDFKWVLAGLAVLSIIYGALMALSETDIKRIVAYASISHLGFIALGIFTLTNNGVNGAVLQVVNHGIIIAALFLAVGIIEERTGTRDIRELGGLEKRMPWFYGFFLVVTLAGLGMPGLNSFAGEFAIMLGAFQLNPAYAVLTGVGVVLACWYMLRLHQGTMHEPTQPRTENVRDLRFGQGLVMVPLVGLMILLGVFPKPVGDVSKPSVQQYVSAATALPAQASTVTGNGP